jgi:hypothetical protein
MLRSDRSATSFPLRVKANELVRADLVRIAPPTGARTCRGTLRSGAKSCHQFRQTTCLFLSRSGFGRLAVVTRVQQTVLVFFGNGGN